MASSRNGGAAGPVSGEHLVVPRVLHRGENGARRPGVTRPGDQAGVATWVPRECSTQVIDNSLTIPAAYLDVRPMALSGWLA